ncbi:unnamed protein product [Rotaria sordida]|uniref:Uncharacterized protein n=1 Tax=Rotaria sordida TaxID=392033 RepID=A0A814WXR2_9BILA|nr:unnamed protein product [Rotaria sordida]CAF1307104.1 unnamed protein product [Rotaria sordida]
MSSKKHKPPKVILITRHPIQKRKVSSRVKTTKHSSVQVQRINSSMRHSRRNISSLKDQNQALSPSSNGERSVEGTSQLDMTLASFKDSSFNKTLWNDQSYISLPSSHVKKSGI